MKANPSRGILTLFRDLGLHVDASSDHEVERALRAGFPPHAIQLTSQMPSRRLAEHVARGVLFNACSLHQLELFGARRPGGQLAVRMNPGPGQRRPPSAPTRADPHRASASGTSTSARCRRSPRAHRLTIRAPAHAHRLGHAILRSGSECPRMTLDLAARFPTSPPSTWAAASRWGAMPEEPTADIADVGAHVRDGLIDFGRARPRAAARARARHLPGRPRRRRGRDVHRRRGYRARWLLLRQARHGDDRGDAARRSTALSIRSTCWPTGARRRRGGLRRPVLRVRRHPDARARAIPRRWRLAWVPRPAHRRSRGGRRRRRVLRRHVHDQLQLLPAGARGDARARRRAATVAPSSKSGSSVGKRGVRTDLQGLSQGGEQWRTPWE